MHEQTPQTSPIADAIEKLRANPEIISMVASALSANNVAKADVAPEEEIKASSDTDEEEKVSPESAPDMGQLVSSLAPLLSSINPKVTRAIPSKEHRSRCSDREALLCALKPYVSENRQTAIEYVIRISQISEMFKGLN